MQLLKLPMLLCLCRQIVHHRWGQCSHPARCWHARAAGGALPISTLALYWLAGGCAIAVVPLTRRGIAVRKFPRCDSIPSAVPSARMLIQQTHTAREPHSAPPMPCSSKHKPVTLHLCPPHTRVLCQRHRPPDDHHEQPVWHLPTHALNCEAPSAAASNLSPLDTGVPWYLNSRIVA